MPPSYRRQQSAQNNAALAELEAKYKGGLLDLEKNKDKRKALFVEGCNVWSGVHFDTNFHKNMELWRACVTLQESCDGVELKQVIYAKLAADHAAHIERVRATIGKHIIGQAAKRDALHELGQQIDRFISNITSNLKKMDDVWASAQPLLHLLDGICPRNQRIALNGDAVVSSSPLSAKYYEYILDALDTTGELGSSRSPQERLALLMNAVDEDPTCHIAWRLVSMFDCLNSDYNRRYTSKGPENYIRHGWKELSIVDVYVRIIEVVPQDYNLWMQIGLYLLSQDRSLGGYDRSRNMLGIEYHRRFNACVRIEGSHCNGMGCVYKAISITSSYEWNQLAPALKHVVSLGYNIIAPQHCVANSIDGSDTTHQLTHKEEYYFGAGYCIAQMKPTTIDDWINVWVEFPTGQETVLIDGKPYTSYDCLERAIEMGFDSVELWCALKIHLSGLQTPTYNADGSTTICSFLYKKKLQITTQYCSIRCLELEPNQANWEMVLQTMVTDDSIVKINGKEYSRDAVINVVMEQNLTTGDDCTIRPHEKCPHAQQPQPPMAGVAPADQEQQLHHSQRLQEELQSWELGYQESLESRDLSTCFWCSLLTFMYCTAMNTIILGGTTFTLLQCAEHCLQYLPSHTEAWEILIREMHRTNTPTATIYDEDKDENVEWTRAACLLQYCLIVGWISTAEIMLPDDRLKTAPGLPTFSKKECYMHGICDTSQQGTLVDYAKAWRGLANCCVEGDVVVAPGGEQFTADQCNKLADIFESKVNFKYGYGYVTTRDIQPVPTTPNGAATPDRSVTTSDMSVTDTDAPTNHEVPTSTPPPHAIEADAASTPPTSRDDDEDIRIVDNCEEENAATTQLQQQQHSGDHLLSSTVTIIAPDSQASSSTNPASSTSVHVPSTPHLEVPISIPPATIMAAVESEDIHDVVPITTNKQSTSPPPPPGYTITVSINKGMLLEGGWGVLRVVGGVMTAVGNIRNRN